MLEIVWVYGSSGSGKETFIKHIIQNSPKKLIEKLGWKNKKIIIISERLKYIAKHKGDPIIYKRKIILNKVKEKSDKNMVILIKGQDSDFEFNLLNKLKKIVPKANYKIVFLHTNLKKLYSRCKKKIWWTIDVPMATLKKWLDFQLEQLRDLKGFKFIKLDSSDMEYKLIKNRSGGLGC